MNIEYVLTVTVDTPVGVPGPIEHTLIAGWAPLSQRAGHVVELTVGAPRLLCLLPCGEHQSLKIGLGEGRAVRGLAAAQVIKVFRGIVGLVVILISWVSLRSRDSRDCKMLPSVPSKPHHP